MSLQKQIKARKAGAEFFDARTQISVGDLMEKHPDGITIIDVFIGTGANGEYVAFHTLEEPDTFSFGGTVLLNIVKEWAAEAGGIEVVNKDLNADMSKTKFVRKVNKFNKPYYDVE